MTLKRFEFARDTAGFPMPLPGKIAVLAASANCDYRRLFGENVFLFSSFAPDVARLSALGYSVKTDPDGEYDASIVHASRARLQTLGNIAEAFRLTRPGGLVAVDGAKTDGIQSALDQCKKAGLVLCSVSKSHGKLFWMDRPERVPEPVSLWAAALELSTNEDGFLTSAGVFSQDRIDTGSALLAGCFDHRLRGTVADLGAGWGWLSVKASEKGKITGLDLFEADAAALRAARANLGSTQARFHWCDVRTLRTETKYDAVICNPPFHQTRAADPTIGLDFLKTAAGILTPGGALWLVANRHLPYEKSLNELFASVLVLDQTPQYKVFLAQKPRTSSSRTHREKPVHSIS